MSEKTSAVIMSFYLMYGFISALSIYVLILTYGKWSFPNTLIPIGVFCFMFGMIVFEYKTKRITKLFECIYGEETK